MSVALPETWGTEVDVGHRGIHVRRVEANMLLQRTHHDPLDSSRVSHSLSCLGQDSCDIAILHLGFKTQ